MSVLDSPFRLLNIIRHVTKISTDVVPGYNYKFVPNRFRSRCDLYQSCHFEFVWFEEGDLVFL